MLITANTRSTAWKKRLASGNRTKTNLSQKRKNCTEFYVGRNGDGAPGVLGLSEIIIWPGSFVDCSPRLILPWMREALLGLKSKSCCMSLGSTLNTACRSPFSFWHAAEESAFPPLNCCNHKSKYTSVYYRLKTKAMFETEWQCKCRQSYLVGSRTLVDKCIIYHMNRGPNIKEDISGMLSRRNNHKQTSEIEKVI